MIKYFWLFCLMILPGCMVFQPPGFGTEVHNNKPARFWLYLPDTYNSSLQYPLIITLHGMKPFDGYRGQCREWQEQADRYGFIICSPELFSSDLFSPLPLGHITKSLQRDESNILKILEKLSIESWYDPDRVYLTSWSYGGYIAHYMANKHPDLFTGLAVRQSNFSEKILDIDNFKCYRYNHIAIFYSENDFNICRKESLKAVNWYKEHNFRVTVNETVGAGHRRIPETAARFFYLNY